MGRFEIIGIVVLVVVLMMGCLTMAHPSSNNPTPTPTVVPTVEASVAATPTVKATATPTVKATATPAKPTATPGTASDSDFSMTARSQGTYLESNQFEQPSAGDKYVQIYVEVTNKNQKDAMIGNQFQFTLFDNKNIGHQAATASFGAPNNLQSLNHANPGDKVAGVIIFEMPTGNIPSKIVFDEPGLFGGSLTVNF